MLLLILSPYWVVLPEPIFGIEKVPSGLLRGIRGISFLSKALRLETHDTTIIHEPVSIYKHFHTIPH